jgi:ABC-type uncharacterized transport system substrate-binding protein
MQRLQTRAVSSSDTDTIRTIGILHLVHRNVMLIAATTTPAALAAKAATTTIPIVFETGDPVRLGLVPSLSRPGGNVTGVTQLNTEVMPKRLELMHELVPTATVIPLLVNPNSLNLADIVLRDSQAAAKALGLKLNVLHDAYRLAGVYAARILKGEKPGELPVQQATKVELFVNLKTAKALGITVPTALLVRADEVIE